MRSFRSDPYLWVHLAGVAAVPIFLELCLLGLGMGRSLMPIWFELLFVGGLGIAPILWMQWQKPFCIFSLLLLALRPDQLSEDQRRLLGLFKSPVNQFLSVGVAVLMAGVLWRFYEAAPIANGLLFPSATRGTGLLVAAIAFFFANLFLQVPTSVLRVLLVGESVFAATEPYPVNQIPTAFTSVGLRVRKILPALIPKPSKPVVIRPLKVSTPEAVQKIEAEIQPDPQPDLQGAVAEVTEVGEAIAPEIEAVNGAIAESTPAAEEGIAAVFEESLLEDEIFEEATSEEEPDATTEGSAVEGETALEEFAEEAIAYQESEAVIESEIMESEIIELEVVALGDESFLDADEIAEVVEIKSIEIEVVEIVVEIREEDVEMSSEEGRAIAPELEEEDWGDEEDLNDL